MSLLGYFNPFSFLITPVKAAYKAISSFEHLIETLNNYEQLDEITKDIAAYEYQSLSVEMNELLEFCSNQLNLDLTKQENGTFYTIFSLYNSENLGEYKYPVKELILLAIAANNQLAARYRNVLFAKENLSLLPLLVGGKEYISIFIKRFPSLYSDLKKQTITLPGNQTIGFFSVIALRKEPELLNAVFLQDVLNDLTKELQKAKDDQLYGILETAALIENKRFIEIILNSIEKCVNEKGENEQGEKELLKNSFISFLDTAISQEHASIVKYLCEKCTESNDQGIQAIYKEALADDKIFEALNKQKIMRKTTDEISGEKNTRNAKAKEIYNLVLTTASSTGSVELITKILEKIESDSIDDNKQKFLQHSLRIILENSADSSVRKIIRSFNEVLNEKNLAKERNNTIINSSIKEDNRMNQSDLNEKQKQLKNAIESCNPQKVTDCLNNDAIVSDAVIKVLLKKGKSKNLSSEQKENLVEIANLLLEKLKNDPNRNEEIGKLQSFIAKYQVEENKSQQQQSLSSGSDGEPQTPSSFVSSNGSNSSFDQVEQTTSDRESETSPSSKGSSFSMIGSGQSTSGDEEGKGLDNTLVESQSQESGDTGEKIVETDKVDKEVEGSGTEGDDQAGSEKDIQEEVQDSTPTLPQPPEGSDNKAELKIVVETGQVDEKVQGLNTEKDQIQPSNNGDEGDNKSNGSLNSESLEKENITVIELSGTTTASSSPFTPSACSTPATNQQIRKHDNNLDRSSSDDDQSQTSEQLKDNGNTDSENIKRSTELENSKDDQPKIPEQCTCSDNTDSEDTKRSAASIVAISTLAIAAAALVAASIYFEVMLTAGAIAGACCLAAAVITYCYTQPSTSIKDTDVDEKKPPLSKVVG